MKIRPATPNELTTIDELMAPEIKAGFLLPRTENASHFLVAEEHHEIIGAVALRPLTKQVAELCSLVARDKGRGIGRRLVEALVIWAEHLGYEEVMALTESTQFFERCRFQSLSIAPWQRQSVKRTSPFAHTIVEANQVKARTCRRCSRRPTCRQTLLNLSLEKDAA